MVPGAMLTRLEIDGFKSLQDFAVDLEPFTVFIGPNSAGKSNVLEALALLSRLATMPIAEAFKHGRGRPSDQFARRGPDGAPVREIRFAVEFLDLGIYRHAGTLPSPLEQTRYRYELTIERSTSPSAAEQLVVAGEQLSMMRREEDLWIASHPEFVDFATYEHGGEVGLKSSRRPSEDDVLPVMGAMPPHWIEGKQVERTHTGLSAFLHYLADPGLIQNLERFRFLRPDAARLGDPSDPLDSGQLAADASNLPTVLAKLSSRTLGAIRADLVALVPGVASFEVVPAGDELRIDFELSGGERMPARLVSDGTLRILLLLTALRLTPRPSLIAIEEPENGIYPGRLRALVDLLRGETVCRRDPSATELRATQILVTSHSPVILTALRKHPQHLRFIDVVRRDGRRVTRVRGVGPSAEKGRATVSLREIDQILQSAQSEEP